MKKTNLVAVVTIIGGTVASTAYVMKAYDKKAKELGYTYNKETKQYEMKYEYNNVMDSIAFTTSHACDQLVMDMAREEAQKKAGTAFWAVCAVVGFVCGCINRRNKK